MEQEKEVGIRDVIKRTGSWFKYLLSKWIVIVAAGIIGGIAGVLYASFSKPTYTASLNFILANTSQNNAGLMNIASQFGVDVTGGGDDVFSGDNIIALMKSRRMLEQALLQKPANSNQSLLNLYCKQYDLLKDWNKLSYLKNAYPFPDSLSNMTPVQDSLFREVYLLVGKKNIDVSKPDKNEGIYNVVTNSTSESFSYYLTRYIVDVTSSFYIDTKTKTSKNNLNMLQREADSLRRLLGGAITNVGAETDETFNLNPAYQVKRSSSQQSQAQATIVATAYGEVVKNLELAKITLQKETPLYQIIDEPALPLQKETKSKLIYLILGGMAGGVVIIGWLTMLRLKAAYF